MVSTTFSRPDQHSQGGGGAGGLPCPPHGPVQKLSLPDLPLPDGLRQAVRLVVKDELDLGRMQAATEIFRGFHDFASFADKKIDKHLSTEVQIDRTDLEPGGT